MTRPSVFSTLDTLFRVALALVFLAAAWPKIQDPAAFAVSVANYRLLPSFAVGLFALTLPMVELLAALALVFTRWSREAALVLLGLLGMFFIGLTQALVRGLDISCGCFGGADATTGSASIAWALVRDVALILPAAWLARRPNAWLWQGTGGLAALVLLAASPALMLLPSAPRPSPAPGTATAPTTASANVARPDDGFPTITPGPLAHVAPETWTTDFVAAFAQARAEHRPLVLYSAAQKCVYCARLRKALRGPVFQHWIKGTGIYLAEETVTAANAKDGLPPLTKFVMATPIARDPGPPHIGIYWPREQGPDVRISFSGRRGIMPGKPHRALVGQFVNALSFVLNDYLKTLGTRPTLAEALATAPRTVTSACSGGGTVTMNPASGTILDGSTVVLHAHPKKGWRFKHWLSPQGKVIKYLIQKDPWKLTVTYEMATGTYTAVFRKK